MIGIKDLTRNFNTFMFFGIELRQKKILKMFHTLTKRRINQVGLDQLG